MSQEEGEEQNMSQARELVGGTRGIRDKGDEKGDEGNEKRRSRGRSIVGNGKRTGNDIGASVMVGGRRGNPKGMRMWEAGPIAAVSVAILAASVT